MVGNYRPNHTSNPASAYRIAMNHYERSLIQSYIDAAGGKMPLAAEMLGVTPKYLYQRCRLLEVGPHAPGKPPRKIRRRKPKLQPPTPAVEQESVP